MNLIKELVYRLRGEYTTDKLISMGMKAGKNFKRMHGTILDPSHCWLIEIGDNVVLAPRVHILCHDASTKMHLGYTKIGNVKIGNNVFIGAGTVVLPGVTIGNNVIVGANSTVTRSIPDGMMAAGSPARILCTTEEYLQKERERMKTSPVFGKEYTLAGNITLLQKEEQKAKLSDGRIGFVE
jgi:maltose O-acetyltransferase